VNVRVGLFCTIPLFLGGFVMLAAPACDDTPTHIFYGQQYDPDLGCLETVTAVDTIGGDDTGQNCAISCVESIDPEAGATAYASTTCPPYPPLFTVNSGDALCVAAVAAAKTGTSCLDDGGVEVTNPIDSGTPTDAGVSDASTD
jgi:hypothetical protein